MVIQAPIAIGGVGGSGTRVIASILKEVGIYIGGDLNHANDNLWFTLLFKHRDALNLNNTEFNKRLAIFEAAMDKETV